MRVIEGESKFTIQNFDKWIDAAMLKKGVQYYQSGAVLDIEENNGNWTAEVEGTEVYSVTVSLIKDKEIDEYFCDCPHDADICKHLTAVFFAIREEISTRITIPKNSKKKNPFDDLLSKITAEEYGSFVKEYATKHKDFKTAFEIFFADKDDNIDIAVKYTDLIRKLVKKHSDHGYVDYRSSSILAKEIDRLLGKSYELAKRGNYVDAFAIAIVVLTEMLEVLSYSDDSSGSLGGIAYSSVEAITSIAEDEDTPLDMKEHIFNILKSEFANKNYFGFGDFGYDLFSVFEDLAALLNKEEAFLNSIDKQLARLTGRYDNYQREFFNNAKIRFFEAAGKTSEVEKLVQQNLDIPSVRQGEVDKAIEKKDYGEAKKLIAGGIKIAEANDHPGTVSQWEKQLLRIAVLENELELVRYYYKRFALDRRSIDTDYFNQWKAAYDKDKWPVVIEDVIAETIKKATEEHKGNKWATLNYLVLQAVAPLYIKEKYWDRLFDLVKNETKLDILLRYHEYLMPLYPDELLQIYLPGLEKSGDSAADRSVYANLAALMKSLIKDIPSGKEQIIATAQRLMLKYPRRPAMIEELKKVLK